jgi:hypothetical protein
MWPVPDEEIRGQLCIFPKCKPKKAFKSSPAQPPMGLNLSVTQKPHDTVLQAREPCSMGGSVSREILDAAGKRGAG